MLSSLFPRRSLGFSVFLRFFSSPPPVRPPPRFFRPQWKWRANKFSAEIDESVKRIFNPQLVKRVGSLPLHQRILIRWRRVVRALLPLGGSSEGNKITIYFDGDSAFPAMWAAIESAQHSICLESYIFEPDAVGRRTAALLCKAAERGVSVCLLFDSWGSKNLLSDWSVVDELKAAGVSVVQFNPIMGLPWRTHLLFRNHRKILIVDKAVGFCGGMNMAKEYCGPRYGGTGEFRDTHLKVEGPAAADLLRVFTDSYLEAFPSSPGPIHENYQTFKHTKSVGQMTGEELQEEQEREKQEALVHTRDFHKQEQARAQEKSEAPAVAGESPAPPISEWSVTSENVFVQVLKSNVWRNALLIQKAMRITLRSAHHRAYITNPYFLPPRRLRQALFTARANGVDVRVLMAGEGRSDVPFARWASQYIYSVMLKRGIRIYELQSQTLHAKTVTIDGIYCSVGSFNLDSFSDALNLEVNLTMINPSMASALEKNFFHDLLNAKEITIDGLENRLWYQKILHWFAYQVFRFFPILPN